MMKASEKAKELVDRMYKLLTRDYADNDYAQIVANKMWYYEAIQCALICVDQILKEVRDFCDINNTDDRLTYDDRMEYWLEVRDEIEKLNNEKVKV